MVKKNSSYNSVIKSEGNSFEIDTFREAINFLTDDLIFNLKTPTRPHLCLAKFSVCSELVYKRVVPKLKAYEKCQFSNCSDLINIQCFQYWWCIFLVFNIFSLYAEALTFPLRVPTRLFIILFRFCTE